MKQPDQVKMYRLRRKKAPGSGGELNCVFKEINKLKSETEGMVTSGRDCTTLLRFQELKNNFGPGEVVPTFKSSTQKAERWADL